MEQTRKESFKLHNDYYEMIKELPTNQKGLLMTAFFEYQINGVEIDLPPLARVIFKFVKKNFDYETSKYQEVCQRNKANGSTGGRPKNEYPSRLIENPKNPVGFLETQNNRTVATETQNNPKNPNEPDQNRLDKNRYRKKDISNDISKESKKFIPPTLEEIKNYVSEKKLFVDPDKFFAYFQEGSWTDSNGNRVRNWKQKLLTWDSKGRVEKTLDAAKGLLKSAVKSGSYSEEIPL